MNASEEGILEILALAMAATNKYIRSERNGECVGNAGHELN